MKKFLLYIIAYGISIIIIAFVHSLFFYLRHTLQYPESRQTGCRLFFHYYFYNGFLASVFIYVLYVVIATIIPRSSIHKKAAVLSITLSILVFLYLLILPGAGAAGGLIFGVPFLLLFSNVIPAYLIYGVQSILLRIWKLLGAT